ncbi:hypothetical protein V6N13_064281 [Hibiscus sabdariffa]
MLHAAERGEEVICGQEGCGNVTIPFPFGMHKSCYSHSWFRVTCKQTHDGEKPFISINDMDLEVLGSLFTPGTILVKNPVTYVNCDHKRDTIVRVNLTGTPFFFSTDYNMFGSVGCGNLATIFSNDAEPGGGCIQPKCGVGASEAEAGCFNQVFGNFSSTMVNMTPMYPGAKDESKRCTSAFLFSRLYFHGDDPLALSNGINIETTHVPTTLSWNSTHCGDAGCIPGSGLEPINFNSENSCGNVKVQYPFEINDRHYLNDSWSKVICKKTTNGQSVPFLNINGINMQILDFSFLLGNVVVNHSITYFNCVKKNNNGMSLNLTATPFYYSDFGNVIWSWGCGNLVTVFGNKTSNLIGGCLQPSCRNSNEASSATGCPTNVPHGLTSFFVNMSGMVDSSDYSRKRSCGFASIVTSDLYYKLTLEPQDFDINNWTHVPISLQCGTPIPALCHLRQGLHSTCTSDQQTCWQSLDSTHLCVCNKDYGLGDFSRLCKVLNDGPEEEIIAMAKIAKRCLYLDGKKRPTMKQVAMQLELIQASKEGNVIEQSGDDESEIYEITETWDDFPSFSMTRSIRIDSLTLPLNASF